MDNFENKVLKELKALSLEEFINGEHEKVRQYTVNASIPDSEGDAYMFTLNQWNKLFERIHIGSDTDGQRLLKQFAVVDLFRKASGFAEESNYMLCPMFDEEIWNYNEKDTVMGSRTIGHEEERVNRLIESDGNSWKRVTGVIGCRAEHYYTAMSGAILSKLSEMSYAITDPFYATIQDEINSFFSNGDEPFNSLFNLIKEHVALKMTPGGGMYNDNPTFDDLFRHIISDAIGAEWAKNIYMVRIQFDDIGAAIRRVDHSNYPFIQLLKDIQSDAPQPYSRTLVAQRGLTVDQIVRYYSIVKAVTDRKSKQMCDLTTDEGRIEILKFIEKAINDISYRVHGRVCVFYPDNSKLSIDMLYCGRDDNHGNKYFYNAEDDDARNGYPHGIRNFMKQAMTDIFQNGNIARAYHQSLGSKVWMSLACMLPITTAHVDLDSELAEIRDEVAKINKMQEQISNLEAEVNELFEAENEEKHDKEQQIDLIGADLKRKIDETVVIIDSTLKRINDLTDETLQSKEFLEALLLKLREINLINN